MGKVIGSIEIKAGKKTKKVFVVPLDNPIDSLQSIIRPIWAASNMERPVTFNYEDNRVEFQSEADAEKYMETYND